jgi:hypothetical protein
MYVSLYGDATYQVTRTDGLAFDADPKSITYEVDGGIADGKTHEEIADQVAAISTSAPAAEEAAAGGESKEEATADKPAAEAASGAASTVAAGTIMGIITSTLML